MIFTIGWAVWIAGFFALETPALLRKQPGDTLSEHMWDWFHIRDTRPTALTWIGRGLLLIAGIWLTGHLAFGWWTL